MNSTVKNKDLNLDLILEEVKKFYKVIVIDFLITDSYNRILIQKRSPNRKHFPNQWEVPGGKLEKGETIEECIKREMKEECAMELVEIVSLVHKFQWENDESVINLQFLVRASGEYTPEKDKVTEHKWVEQSEIDFLLQNNSGSTQIYKGVFYAFGYLEGLKSSAEYNFDYQRFFADLIKKFFSFTGTKLKIPEVQIKNLPTGNNIRTDYDSGILEIDIKLLTSTNVFFSSIVILHDMYHNLKQGITAYQDVVAIRDIFGQNEMLMFDIDADVEIFRFLQKEYGFSFQKYLEVLWEGSTVFRDVVTRMPKVQRFMGSIMSIYALSRNQKIIFFPNITKIHETLFVISASSTGLKFHQLGIKDFDLHKTITAFQDVNKLNKEEFTKTLTDFCDYFVNQMI